ncbi:DNA topoisomerase III [Lentilactobacillus farraginis DSM 18382 = JCM 14108]|uniref:DNA topoisomerase III n=1 Tax=Lentilactobacillus farraginis DSM 18382 = JCM 14108 TaxID=1423743 RepID=X0QH42_9LACO|nr:DNA topoisomerase III [Lentilactobacillus farraginis DSM 18382 = JCM 14108]
MYSIGRVQTPTLYMVYQRDQAIKNFKPEPYFGLDPAGRCRYIMDEYW